LKILNDSELSLQALIESFSTPIFVKDREHRWVMFNEAFCALVGRTREELLGRSDYEFFPKEEADTFWEKDELVFTSGRENVNAEPITTAAGEKRLLTTTKTLFTDSRGVPRLIGVIRDSTDERRTLADLRLKSNLLQALNDASIAGTLVVSDSDEQRRIIYANRRFAEMWGISPEDQASNSDDELIAAVLGKIANPGAFEERVSYLYQHREETSRDEILLRDGRVFERYSSPVRGSSGEYFGRVWNFRDITDLRKLESLKAEVKQRRELAALKDQFVGTVSHELRTPLALVMTAIDSLRKGLAGDLSPKQRDVAELCHRNIVRLSRMINNLLDISRLEAGTANRRIARLDFVEFLADLEANYRMMGRVKRLKLQITAPADLPDVRADPEMIMQVLDILLDNAERFAVKEIVVRASRGEGGVRVEVIDDGPGVPADRVAELFNKFSQVARSIGGGYKGTGLGLAICKEILALHGSTIEVDSPPGRGARFHFLLPAWENPENPLKRHRGQKGVSHG
jgi:two-component system sensor histidine kinase/response regulator